MAGTLTDHDVTTGVPYLIGRFFALSDLRRWIGTEGEDANIGQMQLVLRYLALLANLKGAEKKHPAINGLISQRAATSAKLRW